MASTFLKQKAAEQQKQEKKISAPVTAPKFTFQPALKEQKTVSQNTVQEPGMTDRLREEEALRQKNARAQEARDRRTPDAGTEQVNRTPMQDRARMTREKSAYQLGDIRNENGRVGKAVQSIGLDTMGSVQFLGDTLKQSRDNAEAYQKSGLQDKANQALDRIKLAKALHGEGSPEHLQAQKDYDDLRRTIMQWNSEPNKAVKQDTLGYRMLEESGRLQEEALEGTEGAGRFLGEAAINIADNLGTVLATGGNPVAAATMMGAKAAAGKAKELTERGVSASEALVRGTVSGAIEAATEKIPLDNMLDVVKSGGQSALKNILKQAGVEGAEEGFSYLFNYLADKAARDPNAVFRPEELLEQIASGAFSGLVFGAGGTAVNRMAAAEAPEVMGLPNKKSQIDTSKPGGELQGESGDKTKSALAGGGPDQSPIPSGGSSADFNANIQQEGTDVKPVDMPMLTAEERETGIIRETKNAAGQSQAAKVERENDKRGIVAKLQENIPALQNEPILREVQGTEFDKSQGKLTDTVSLFFKAIGNKVFRKGFGTVLMDKSSVDDDIAHGIGKAKAATFSAVPDVIEKGKQIDYQKNWKGKGKDSYVFAGKVNVEGKTGYLAAVVLQGNDNKFYLHEVVDEKGNFIFISKKDAGTGVQDRTNRESGDTGARVASSAGADALDQNRTSPAGSESNAGPNFSVTQQGNAVKPVDLPMLTAEERAKQGIGTALEASLTGAETLGQKEQRTGSPLPSVVESQLEALAAMMPDYQEDLMDTAETIRKYQGEEAALAFLKQQREGQTQEAGAEQNLRPTPENSGAVTDEQGNVVGTRATQKIGLKVESPIADMTAVQKAREAQWGLDVTQKQIREAEKRTRASAAEKRMAERIAKGEDSLDSFVYGWDGKDNRRRTVVEELSALYRLRDTYDAKAVKSLGKRNRDIFIDTLNREVLNRMDQAKPPKAASLHTNTWERNNLRTWGRELGQKVNQLLFDPVKQNEAQRIRWLNDQAEEMAFLSQLTERENAAVFQMLDDGRSADSFGGDVRRDLVQKAADKLRQKYSDYYDAINDVLVAHGYEEIGFIKNYTPHMQEEQMRKAMSIFERLGISEQVAELPTELAGRTDMFRPGKKWDPHFLHRTGEKSAMDAVGGFLSYANYMSEVLHHVDDIQKLRTFSDQIRYEYADEGLRADYDAIRESKDMTQEQKDAELEKLRDRKDNNSKMGAYVTALDNYTNILAGKQTQLDRAVETAIGRKGLNLIQKPIQTLVKSSIPGNLSSAINQTVQLPWLTAEAGEGNVIQAVYELARGKLKKEGFVRESDFLTGKRGAEALQKLKQKTAGEKILDAASIPFEAVDDAASQVIVRAFYLKNVKDGMDHKAALQQADAQAERLVGSRMKGAKANIFSDKSLKLLTTFQLEVANQYEHLKYDLPQEIREIERTRGKGAAAAEASKRIVKGSVYAAVLNGIIKSITGNEPVGFDIIGTVWNYIRAGLPEDDEEEQGFDWTAGLEDVRDSVLDDVPYVSTIATMLGYGNGRLPLPQADATNIKNGVKKIFSAEDDAEKDAGIRQLLTGVLKTAAAVTPMGNQVRKTIEGGETAIRGGRYSADGSQLLYEVEKSPKNIARGLLFGRSALPETDAYYEKGGKPVLSKDQTGMMEKAAEYGVDQGTYVRFIQEAKKLKGDKDEAGETVTGSLERKKIALLDGMDLDGEQKLNLYLDNVASDSRKEDVEALQAAGMTWEEIAPALDTYLGLSGSEGSAAEKATKLAAWADENLTEDQAAAVKDRLDYWQMMRAEASTYEKLTEAGMSADKASAVYDLYQSLEPEDGKTTVSESQKLQAVAGSRDLSEEDKRKAVAAMLSDTALDKFNTCVKAGVNVSSYVGVKEYYGSTSADKDAKGKTVSGSKQKKVVAYINGLPISEGQKDALYLVYYQPSGLKDTPWHNGIVGLPVLPEAERKSPLELPNVEEPAWKTVLNLP